MTYPVAVSTTTGNVTALPGVEEFPDVGGKITGTPGGTLPHALTT